jgi:hypothetical protein
MQGRKRKEKRMKKRKSNNESGSIVFLYLLFASYWDDVIAYIKSFNLPNNSQKKKC